MNKKNKTIIVICGPTASGKTGVAIELAEHFKTEIISADSRQCFKELNIGVARPSPVDLEKVEHHFIASHSIHQQVNAGSFEQYALEKAKDLFQQHDTIVMVGGTGLYIKAFCEGLDEIPTVVPEIRDRICRSFDEKGLAWLQEEIKLKDKEFYDSGELYNPRRLMRALEIIDSTGQSILHFRKGKKATRDFNIVKMGLELQKQPLHKNINVRIDNMINQGLVNEVKDLESNRHLNALQTVGYTEIFNYLDGKSSLDEAINAIKINTRQYAKRQLTWFRKDREIKWYHPSEIKKMIGFIQMQDWKATTE